MRSQWNTKAFQRGRREKEACRRRYRGGQRVRWGVCSVRSLYRGHTQYGRKGGPRPPAEKQVSKPEGKLQSKWANIPLLHVKLAAPGDKLRGKLQRISQKLEIRNKLGLYWLWIGLNWVCFGFNWVWIGFVFCEIIVFRWKMGEIGFVLHKRVDL